MRVPYELELAARRNYVRENRWPWRKSFYKTIGMTEKQVQRYEQTGTMKVSKLTFRKLQVLALPNSPHRHTLLKILDARK